MREIKPKDCFDIVPIGHIKSRIKNLHDMPGEGVQASVVLKNKYLPASHNMQENTHYYVISWLHLSPREVLKVSPKRKRDLPPKGIFSLRAPVRPNPIGLTVSRLLKVEESELFFEKLDFIDHTPVIDIKPYTLGWDLIHCARNQGEADLYTRMNREECLDDFFRQVRNFSGKLTPWAIIGARALYLFVLREGGYLRDPDLRIVISGHPDMIDATRALTSASAKRLLIRRGPPAINLISPQGELTLSINAMSRISLKQARTIKDKDLFRFE